MTALGTLSGTGGQKHLQRRMGEDDGAHVAAIREQARKALKTVLKCYQRGANRR